MTLMFSLGEDLEVCIKSVHTRFQVIRISASQFRQARLLKEFVHSIELDKHMSTVRFVAFPYLPSDVHRVCSGVLAFISDIGNSIFSPFF